MLKVNSKDKRTIVNFEHVIAGWECMGLSMCISVFIAYTRMYGPTVPCIVPYGLNTRIQEIKPVHFHIQSVFESVMGR